MTTEAEQTTHRHFKGKGAIGHVAEAQARGIISSSEIHGTEIPGHISAAADAARETTVILALAWALLSHLSVGEPALLGALFFLSLGLLFWKFGRAAWLGWSRLERLHRIVAEERWEIEYHRPQEREELKELYAAKGFEGKLLEEVLDVLMADGDRLLRVMVEEELGLTLGVHEHPLKQALGAAVGVLFAAVLCLAAVAWLPLYACGLVAVAVMAAAAALSAFFEHNRFVPAIVWNLGILALAFSATYFVLQWWLLS